MKLSILFLSPAFGFIGNLSYDKETNRHVVDKALTVGVDYQTMQPAFQGGPIRYSRNYNLTPLLGATGPCRVYISNYAASFGPVEVDDLQTVVLYESVVKSLETPPIVVKSLETPPIEEPGKTNLNLVKP